MYQSSPTRHDASAPAIDWPRFVELIRGAEQFLLTTHVRPDCDAIGSTLAMAGILERLAKKVLVVTGFDVPAGLRFLDPEGRVKRIGRDITVEQLGGIDLLMVLDTCAWAQLGDMGDVIRATRAKKAVLDHHVTSDDLGADLFRDVHAEATGRLVYEAAGQLGVEITPEIAAPMFAALATDTGWFRFASATSDTYRLAAQIIDAGAVPHLMYKDLYENDTVGRLRLLGQAMARVEMELGGRLVHTYLTREDFAAAGAVPSDSEDIINMTLSVAGTEVAVILVEQPAGGFKVSFRSRCDLDCSRLAARFGGGGHRAAAGAFVPGPLPIAQPKVLDAVRAAMQ